MWGTRKVLEELAALRRDSTEQLAALRQESAQQHAEARAMIKEFAQRSEDERRIDREILRRNEIVMRELIDTVAEFKEESRRTQAFARRAAEATEAHTRAIFALIDRLGNGPAPAGGAA